MDLTATQRERVDAVLHFARTRLSQDARKREAAGTFDRKLWNEAAEFGLTGLPIPEQWGGSGLDAVDTMLVVEALGKGCEDGGLVFSLCAHMFASAVPIWRSRSTRAPRALPARHRDRQADLRQRHHPSPRPAPTCTR